MYYLTQFLGMKHLSFFVFSLKCSKKSQETFHLDLDLIFGILSTSPVSFIISSNVVALFFTLPYILELYHSGDDILHIIP